MDEGWLRAIDDYCERLDPSFWAEPLNAVSNAAFLIAAYVGWREARRLGRMEPMVFVLVWLAVIVGLGSFLFHTVARRWAELADVLPILVFVLVYLWAAGRRFLGLSPLAAILPPAAVVGAFYLGFGPLWRAYLPSLNGSEAYLPVLVAMLLFGAAASARGHPVAPWFYACAAIFAASLAFRSLDETACAAFPRGVHFLWHCFNGLLLGTAIVAYVRHGAREAPDAG